MIEGTTRGRSGINPKEFKGDKLVQVWMDTRVLSALADWLEDGGRRPRYLSDVIKVTLDMLIETLVDSGQIVMNDSPMEARSKLAYRFNIVMPENGRGTKNLLNNVVLNDKMREEAEEEQRRYNQAGLEKIKQLRGETKTNNEVSAPKIVNNEQEERLKSIRELTSGFNDLGQREPLQNNIHPAQEDIDKYDSCNLGPVKEKMTDEECEEHLRKSEECYNSVSDEDILTAMRQKLLRDAKSPAER